MKASSLATLCVAALLGLGTLAAPELSAQRRGGNGGSRPSSVSRQSSGPSSRASSTSRPSSPSSRPSVSSSARPGAGGGQSANKPQSQPINNAVTGGQIRPSVQSNRNERPTSFSQGSQPTSSRGQGGRPGNSGNNGNGNGNNGGIQPGNNGNGGGNSGRPVYTPTNGGSRPGVAGNNRPSGGQQGPSYQPGPAPSRPNNGPGHGPNNGPRPGYDHNGYFWAGAPAAGWGWHRPVPPPRWSPAPGLPPVATFLNLTFGTALNVTLNLLGANNIAYYPYSNGAVSIAGVNYLNCYWPEARLIYTNGLLTGQQFFFTSNYYDPSRYNLVYNMLTSLYGYPVSNSTLSAGMTTTWFGANRGFITLSFEPMMGAYGNTYYYTTLSIGN